MVRAPGSWSCAPLLGCVGAYALGHTAFLLAAMVTDRGVRTRVGSPS